jgi:peptidyl-prolyl cis-trans isomerase D
MFEFVRSHNRVLQVVLGIVIIPTFGFVGLQSYLQSNEEAVAVASVDGRDITRAEWQQQRRTDADTIRTRNPKVDLKLLDTPEFQRQSLDSLVRERVMRAAIVHEGLTVSDERILNEYRSNPQYDQLRAMTKEQRDAFLAARGLSGNLLFQNIGEELSRTQVQRGVGESGFVPATSRKAAFDALFDMRDIQWQRFDAKDYAAAIQPTDAQVEAYYKAHTSAFFAPEQARIEYLVLDAPALQAQVKADPTLVQEYYKNNAKRYTTPEERRASHILINVAPNATPADVDKAKAQAESLLAEVRKNPAAFADVARKSSQDSGSAAQGGDLDFMTKGAIPGAFSDTLFAMKEGDVSNVVRSDAGFHIIKLTGVRGGAVKTFEEVKPQIEDLLKTQEAQKLYTNDVDKFTNIVFEQPDSLDPAAKALQLTKQSATVLRQPAAGATGPLASPKLLEAVFASDSIKSKHNTEAVETATGQRVAAHVIEYSPQHTRPLAEVHDLVVEAVRSDMAAAAAKKDGEARVAAAIKDPSLALPITATVSRFQPSRDVPREVAEAAQKANLAKGPVTLGLALPGGGYAAVRVLKSTPHVPDAAQTEQARAAVSNAFEDAEVQAVYDSLKVRYKVKYYDDRIAKVTSQAASAAN